MAVSTKVIKERLRSVKSSGKVTKAMQLISAAKMRKAVSRAVESRVYAQELQKLAATLAPQVQMERPSPYLRRGSEGEVSSQGDTLSRFFTTPTEIKREILVVIAANRGLCGAFNTNIGKAALRFLDQHGRDKVDVVVVGKKAFGYLGARGVAIDRFYLKQDDPKTSDSITELAEFLHHKVKDSGVDRVTLLYTNFKSSLVQEPKFVQLFPMVGDDMSRFNLDGRLNLDMRLEPDARTILEGLTLAIGESMLYQALLESNASEHSARMMAMQQATKAAGEMFDDLTLLFNKARQAAITQELAEISAGRAALG